MLIRNRRRERAGKRKEVGKSLGGVAGCKLPNEERTVGEPAPLPEQKFLRHPEPACREPSFCPTPLQGLQGTVQTFSSICQPSRVERLSVREP